MITKEEAHHFAQEWMEAWNTHDVERVLSHYTEDFEMSSPFIVGFTGEPSGTLRGKESVRAYWQIALKRVPDLHFELLEVLAGVNSIVIYYNAVLGKRASEVFFLDENGKVFQAFAHYNE